MNAEAVEGLIRLELPAAARGDRQAYARIVAACQNAVTGLALAIVRDVPASEDIAQEAFLSAWQNLRRLQNPASFLPWLRQITRNLARDHLRRQRRLPASAAEADEAIAAAADPQPTALERLIEDERRAAAEELISALPDDSREVLLLYYREGQSSQQVAALLGLNDAAVRKRLSRARAAVRAGLLARFGAFARETAPSAAFTMMVATALGAASPAASAAVVIGSLGAGATGVGLGKLAGGGIGATSAAAGVTGGAAGGVAGYLLDAAPHLDWALAGAAGGMLGTWLGCRYLLGFAGTREERAEILAFSRRLLGVVSLFVGGVFVLALTTRGWLPLALFSLLAVGTLHRMYLHTLPRVMAPCFERLTRVTGRPHPTLAYRLTCGAPATWFSTLFSLAAVAYALVQSGRL
ncbi:RNA polymerase sigma factor [Vulcaniibacterium tengchongense]|uniref:RNA polymerase sigma factor n=1 Tax=Vulcaniibacterium tengchongense TaxID=1273429 RepID=A0A3N4VES2_9GAMM|nr:sigma-70 family RNA polymerase sigma factor [Vulcaniibacterium tengchongense]RPE81158.1 RNA polymerase sigma factor (sigma-70 family) [Vulcaniibacterium tengchongense]